MVSTFRFIFLFNPRFQFWVAAHQKAPSLVYNYAWFKERCLFEASLILPYMEKVALLISVIVID